ncbi:MAG: RDD family protein [Micromonosporaceae bacterium]
MIEERLDRYPYPLAYSARLVHIADDLHDRVDKAGQFLEHTSVTLSLLALGWYRTHGREPGVVRGWLSRLDKGGITLSVSNQVVASTKKHMANGVDDPVARAVRMASEQALSGLESFRKTRNLFAHGGKPRLRHDLGQAVAEQEQVAFAVLDAVQPLTQIRLGRVVRSRGQGANCQLELEVMNGPAEPFAARWTRSRQPYRAGTVLAYHADNLDHAIDLTPYCVWRACPMCRREELFYLHQYKRQQGSYLSFSTGHQLTVKGDALDGAVRIPRQTVGLGMESLGAARSRAISSWRASWSDLAHPGRRVAARALDLVMAFALAAVGWSVGWASDAESWVSVVAGLLLGLSYEPLVALRGGSVGKRVLRIQLISVWDVRPLSRRDALRRAILVNVQWVFLPLGLRNLFWLLADPARQCLHDRSAGSIVVSRR